MKKTARFLACLVCLAPLALASGACGSDESKSDAAAKDGGAEEVTGTIAEMVSVNQIAVYQGTKVVLVDDGALPHPNAPVVPGRPALVRVHARTKLAKAKQPPMMAELRIKTPNKPDIVLTDGPRTLTTLEDSVIFSTFNFDLAGDQIAPDATLSVELKDSTGADSSIVRYPLEGEPPLSMRVGPLAPTVKVKLVPVKYDADGSGRLPKLEPAILEQYEGALYKMYPTAKVEISVRETSIQWPEIIEPNGDGWGSLLDAIIDTRTSDAPPEDVYYIGVFNPAATQSEFCRGGGCVLGLAPQSLVSDTGLRVAMVLGYPGERANGTMAHELAHAMGRDHAPCGSPAGIDPKYPYGRANIGVAGYDIIDKKLIDAESRVYDFMSYCQPVWISDYTWAALYERMAFVETTKRAKTTRSAKTFHMQSDGSMVAGPTISVATDAPNGYRPIAELPGRGLVIAGSKAEAVQIMRGVKKL